MITGGASHAGQRLHCLQSSTDAPQDVDDVSQSEGVAVVDVQNESQVLSDTLGPSAIPFKPNVSPENMVPDYVNLHRWNILLNPSPPPPRLTL